jgi:protein-S-isoprenylcysteine O-methyltransferase Ste14
MVSIGNFFFKYRNIVFIFLYLALFIPSSPLFTQEIFGTDYYWWPIIIGLAITLSGQLIRGATIGLAYIIRGGRDKKVYADSLVTEGIFNHCRNPLYVGNVLMLVGVGILSNSLLYVCLFIPLFLFIYQSIILAEENFLRKKFGYNFNDYCDRVSRWLINLKGIGRTFKNMDFNAKRWILKEYNTLFIWLAGITVILLFKYPQLTGSDTQLRNMVLLVVILILGIFYGYVRYMKKSNKWSAN